MLLGENGIILKTKEAKEETIIANEKEAIKLAYTACKIDEPQSNVSDEDLQNELNRNNHNTTVTTSGENLKVLFNDTKNTYTVYQDGKITDEHEEKQKSIINGKIIDTSNNEEYIAYFELYDGTVFIPKKKIERGDNYITGDDEYEVIITKAGIKQEFINGFIDNDGKVYMWGDNDCGQVGDGTNTYKLMPVCISDIEGSELNDKKIIAISSDGYSTIAIDDNGDIYIWGVLPEEKISNTPICIRREENNMFKNKNIVKFCSTGTENIVIDSEGKVYSFTIGNDLNTELICISDIENSGIENVKIVDVIFLGLLDSEGNIYIQTEMNRFICITEIEESPLYNIKVDKMIIGGVDLIIVDKNKLLYTIGEDGRSYMHYN